MDFSSMGVLMVGFAIFPQMILLLCRYSRRIMWLNVSTCGSATAVAGYYLNCVKKVGGICVCLYV